MESKSKMRRVNNQLPTLGFFIIIAVFIGMISLCLFWGVWEYKKPKDAGPLLIDLDRTTKKRMRERKHTLKRTPICEPSTPIGKDSVLAKSDGITRVSNVNETIRVRGDLRIPKGEIIPFNMIIEGNLFSQENVIFQGALHIKGRAVIGPGNRVEKSIICQKELLLSEDVIIFNCIDSSDRVFVKNGVRVGVGPEGGGINSADIIYLENAGGPLSVHSKKGIRVVGDLNDLISGELKQILEVDAK